MAAHKLLSPYVAFTCISDTKVGVFKMYFSAIT